MNFNVLQYIPTAVRAKGLVLKQHTPVLLFGAGVVAAVTSTVLACRATLKLEEVLTSAQEKAALIDIAWAEDYTPEDKKKDQLTLRVHTAMKIGKLYAPAVGAGVFAVGALTGSHYIMSSRQAALMGAYAALEKGYAEYQERVRSEFGVEREEQLRLGSVTEKTKDDSGKVVKTVKIDPNTHSVYGRFFDEFSTEWVSTPEYNRLTLQAKQAHANNLLKARGYLFLNEVYEMLGFDKTTAGSVVGWIIDPEHDNFVDFGIFNGNSETVRDFVNGHNNSIFLDFNVDGVMYDKIDKFARRSVK